MDESARGSDRRHHQPAPRRKFPRTRAAGDVEAYYNAPIHAQVSGYVKTWRKDIGAKVKAGDILAEIDTPEIDQQIAQAKEELTKVKANQALALITAKRWTALRSSNAVSQQAADEKESDASAKDADVAAAQANVDRVKAQKDFANIVAPFDGVVTARNIDVGALVNSSTNGANSDLFSVADVHEMRIYVKVPQNYTADLHPGNDSDTQVAAVPRPHVRSDDCDDIQRHIQELAFTACRTHGQE